MAVVFNSYKDSSIDENSAPAFIPGIVDKSSLEVGALSLTLKLGDDGSYSISIMLTPDTVSAYSSGVYNFDFELHFDSGNLGPIELSQITSQGAVAAVNTQVLDQISVSFPDSVQVDVPLMTIALGHVADISDISFDITNVTIGLDSLPSSSYKFLPVVVIYTAEVTSDGSDIVYSLLEGSDPALEIDSQTGAVFVAGGLNYQDYSSFNFTVLATDSEGTSVEQAVTVAVNDIDQSAPEITSGDTAVAIDENSGASQIIYIATADDSSDISGGVSFSLHEGSDAALVIDADSGAVTLSIDPDYESQSSYSFNVVATDLAGNTSEQAVTLSVNDIVNVVSGSSGDDQILATGERDLIDGADGVDSVTYSGPIAQYGISRDTSGTILVRDISNNTNAEEATDELTNVESVIFSDDYLALSTAHFEGAEVELNSALAYEPEITALNGGGYVVAWLSGNNTVSGQLFDKTGSKLGDAFTVNDASLSNSAAPPSVAALVDGGFVVTWYSFADQLEIYARRYDMDGVAEQSFEISTDLSGDKQQPAIIGTSDGGYTVSWQGWRSIDGGWGIFAQRYDEANTGGVVFEVNELSGGNQQAPSISELSSGDFVVTWHSYGVNDDDASGEGVYGRLFDSQGDVLGEKFLVNTHTNGSQYNSSVAALADGGFVVTWQSSQDGSENGIFGQRFDQAGAKVDDEFRVNDVTSNNQFDSKVVAMPDGGWMVVYVSYNHPDGEYDSIFSNRVEAECLSMGDELLVSSEEGKLL